MEFCWLVRSYYLLKFIGNHEPPKVSSLSQCKSWAIDTLQVLPNGKQRSGSLWVLGTRFKTNKWQQKQSIRSQQRCREKTGDCGHRAAENRNRLVTMYGIYKLLQEKEDWEWVRDRDLRKKGQYILQPANDWHVNWACLCVENWRRIKRDGMVWVCVHFSNRKEMRAYLMGCVFQ